VRMRAGVILLGLFLSACAPYSPYAVEISDQTLFTADLKTCQTYAASYRAGFSLGGIASAAAEGAANNAPAAAVNPLVPVLGALGGATSATISGLDLMDSSQRKIVARCMTLKGERSRAYLVIDPND
jgi:uncharacterized membrane protein